MPSSLRLPSSSDPLQVVWFKRDLRLADHEPLRCAAERGPTLGLYLYEPEAYRSPTWDPRHFAFLDAAVRALAEDWRGRGGRFLFRAGEAIEVFGRLLDELGPFSLWSHEETGELWSYARDKRMKRWAKASGIAWTELPPAGVFRPHRGRDGWAGRWAARMREPLSPAPETLVSPSIAVDEQAPRSGPELGLSSSTIAVPRGSEADARETLRSFLEERGRGYRGAMASPLLAPSACSRLSPHLAYGTLSSRRVVQSIDRADRRARRGRAPEQGASLQDLESLRSRLAWRCHFMQKLEDEPELEQVNANRALDDMRPMALDDERDRERFGAWAEGRTGVPFVDACMRSLRETGWLNFRMRAMLVSVATHHLWLPWPPVAHHLARLFVDYEPGIHYPQVQMQAASTGNNTLRVYSPAKQARDLDPDGAFARLWVPEVADVDAAALLDPKQGSLFGSLSSAPNYPAPLLDFEAAAAVARERLASWHGRADSRRAAAQVQRRHGSRRRPPPRRRR